jgi:hypothetical protein
MMHGMLLNAMIMEQTYNPMITSCIQAGNYIKI